MKKREFSPRRNHQKETRCWSLAGGCCALGAAPPGLSGAAQPAYFFFPNTCALLMRGGGTEEEIPPARTHTRARARLLQRGELLE